MPNVNKTLEARGSVYGRMQDNSEISQALKRAITKAPNYKALSDTHREALDMIFHKISRMVCGDPYHADNAHDIAGYAKLLEEFINECNDKK